MLERYKEFSENLKRQNVELYTVELAFFDKDFLIEDAYLKLRTNTVLWHKENLLNALVKKLPDGIEKIAWLDSDVLIENDDWAEQAANILDHYRVIEIGDIHTIYLDQEQQTKEVKHTNGYAYHHRKSDWNNMGRYHPGFGWAANRDFFNEVGLYQYDIIGGGDGVMMRSFGEPDAFSSSKHTWKRAQYMNYCKSILPYLEQYSQRAYEYTQGSMSFVPSNVVHKFHGERANRGYTTRMKLLEGIDVDEHLQKSSNGLFEWKNESFNDNFIEFFMIKNDLDPMNHYEYDKSGYVIY